MSTCVVCESETDRVVENLGEFRMYECGACGIQFTDPMKYSTENYDLAYVGSSEAKGLDRFVPFVSWTQQDAPGLPAWKNFLTAAQQSALRYLRQSFPNAAGVKLLDIGCGGGWWLAAASNAGFEVFGLEVGRRPVEILRKQGFNVAHGTVTDFPSRWPTPQIVTMFEVLEHLPAPVEFLREIRTRFPRAQLILSVPSPKRWIMLAGRDDGDYPPNHLTRWTEQSLRSALARVGYSDAVVQAPKPTPTELSMVGVRPFVRRLAARLVGRSPNPTRPEVKMKPLTRPLAREVQIRRLKRVALALPCVALRMTGFDCASLLAITPSRLEM